MDIEKDIYLILALFSVLLSIMGWLYADLLSKLESKITSKVSFIQPSNLVDRIKSKFPNYWVGIFLIFIFNIAAIFTLDYFLPAHSPFLEPHFIKKVDTIAYLAAILIESVVVAIIALVILLILLIYVILILLKIIEKSKGLFGLIGFVVSLVGLKTVDYSDINIGRILIYLLGLLIVITVLEILRRNSKAYKKSPSILTLRNILSLSGLFVFTSILILFTAINFLKAKHSIWLHNEKVLWTTESKQIIKNNPLEVSNIMLGNYTHEEFLGRPKIIPLKSDTINNLHSIRYAIKHKRLLEGHISILFQLKVSQNGVVIDSINLKDKYRGNFGIIIEKSTVLAY